MHNLLNMNVLIIDDDQDSIELAKHLLAQEGYENIQAVSNAREALAAVRQAPPDLVLLDIVMPEMDGIVFCKTIKADSATKDIPVIMISGSFQDSDTALQSAFAAGAIDFIPKPIRGPEILARVKSALSLKQARDRLEQELSKRQLLAERLQAALEFMESFIETSLCAIVITDSNGCISRVNDAYLQMLGYEREEVIGKFMVEMTPGEPGVYETVAGAAVELGEEHFKKARTMVEVLFEQGRVPRFEGFTLRKDGRLILTDENNVLIYNDKREVIAAASILQDISERKHIETEREKLISDLQAALKKVKTLSGMLPICASCKKVRDDKGYWNQIESYLKDHSEAEFSHGICPDCAKKLYPDFYDGE
ncbi:response regulator [Thermodesulfobacteriota bacterium]